MRTVTFSQDAVRKTLNNNFACCYTDTTGDPSAGASFKHGPDDAAGPCGRGAGGQNVQTLFLTPAGEIFHVVTGFITPDELLDELEFTRGLFAKLQAQPASAKETVVTEHRRRLAKLGFSAEQIAARDDELTNMFLSGLNPKDFGMQIPGLQGLPFQDIDRQRTLRDDKFVIAHPLLAREQFERDPGALVGHHKSFFGSHESMNGMTDMFNGNLNQLRGVQPNKNKKR